MRIRSVVLLGLLTFGLPVAAHAAGKCDDGGEHEAAVLAAREAIRAGCDCAGATSHAAYVRCAQDVIAQLADDGTLPRMCRGRLRQYASRSTCGREHLDVCCESRDAFHVRAALRPDGACRIRGNGSFCVSSFPHADEACVQTGTVCRPSVCGDGITDRRNGEGCEPPGVGLCDAFCQVIVCGNGQLDPGEQCEPPNTPTCDHACQPRSCGDGVVNPANEQCEPPGTATCDANCLYIHACGNGVVDLYPGEECEPPGTATCDASCRFIHTCGNGVIEPGEECDGQPACGAGCTLAREACCDFGGACFSQQVSTGFDAYWNVFKLCALLLGGSGSYGSCEGDPCPPPAPPELGCRVASCEDRPIDPLPLCCNAPDGTCSDIVATTGAAIAGFCSYFLPPDQGDVPHLMLGTCGDDGRCVPASGADTTAAP